MRASNGQFQPGRSGNPGGRPPGTSLTAKIRRALEEPDPFDPDKTAGDSIVEAMIAQARRGDVQAFKLLIERCDGKVPDRLETTNGAPAIISSIEVLIPSDGDGDLGDEE